MEQEAPRRDHPAARDAAAAHLLEGLDLQAVLSPLPAIVYVSPRADPDPGPLLYVSPQSEAILGYGHEWLEDAGLWGKVLHPDDRDRALTESLRAHRSGEPWSMDYRLIARDGRVVWIRDRATLVGGADGRAPRWHGVMIDITSEKRAEEALRESEERYRALVEQVPAIVYIDSHEKDPRTLYVSPQVREILGHEQQEYLANEDMWTDTIHPDDLERVLAAWGEAVDSGQPFGLEYRMVRPDGAVVWLRDVATPVRDDEGRPLVWQGLMLDISAEKAAEEALERSESKYRAVVEQIPAITYVQTSDRPALTLYISPQTESLLGISPDEWVGRSGTWASLLHPEDRERVLAEDARTHETAGPFKAEYRLVARDGTVRWFHDEARPVRDGEGVPLFWHGVMLDITDAKLAEEALRDSEARHRALVENIPAVVYVVAPDDDSTTLYVSPQIERLLDYSQQEWLDQPDIWMELLHPDDREDVLAAHDLHNETGEPWRAEYRLIASDGRAVWFRDEATLVRDADGNPLFWQGVRMDITDRKHAEEELQRAREELEMRVLERTVQLTDANEMMMLEIDERRNAERRHREAEERYRTLVEQLPAVAYIWRPDSNVDPRGPASPGTYTSPEIEHMLGYTADEWQSSPFFWLDRVHPDDRERVWAHTVEVEGTGDSFDIQYRYIAKDGRVVWVSDRATPMQRDAAGDPVLYQGVLIDITEQKLAEERLRRTEERYRALVEESPAVVYHWEVGDDVPEGITSYVSPQIEQLLGYTVREWTSHPNMWWQRIHPDDYERVAAETRRCAKALSIFEAEYRLLAKDGEVVWIHDRAAILESGSADRPHVFQGVMLDVTERKRAEAGLREAEALYRSLVEQMPAWVYIEAVEGRGGQPARTLYVSPQIESILGLTPDEITADPRSWERRLHPDDRERAIETDRRCSQSGEPFDLEYRLVARDGHVVWVHSKAALVRDDEGRPKYWQGVTFDITATKRAEEELRRANDELARIARDREEELRDTEDFLRELVASGPGILFRGSTEDGYPLSYISPNVEEILGYPPDELVGVHGRWADIVHPQDRDRLARLVARVLTERKNVFEYDYTGRHRNGSYRRFHSVVHYRYDDAGRPAGFLGVAIDVTHRDAHAEAAAGGVGFEPTSELPR